MKKVLVIGGSGFLGSHVADILTHEEFSVTVFDNKVSKYLQANQKMIIAEKSWAGDRWVFKCIFEDNPIQNQRSV